MDALDQLDALLQLRKPTEIKRPLHVEAATASVGAAIEFFAMRWAWWQARRADLLETLPGVFDGGLLEKIASNCALEMIRLSDQIGPLPPEMQLETAQLCGLPARMIDTEKEWSAFDMSQQSFHAALRDRGLEPPNAAAIVAAFHEMSSNATEHASAPIRPIAAWQVTSDEWEFSVTDVGRGVRESLRQAAAYATVEDIDAMKLALTDGVSCTGIAGRGLGFATVFKALADRSAELRFRSGEVSVAWSGPSPTNQLVTYQVHPASRAGFHMRVRSPIGK
jgi:hypothetical protein